MVVFFTLTTKYAVGVQLNCLKYRKWIFLRNFWIYMKETRFNFPVK